MRKRLCALLALVLLFGASAASAELSARAVITSEDENGTVAAFTLVNGETDATDLVLTYADGVSLPSPGDVAAGQTREGSVRLPIGTDELTLAYLSEGQRVETVVPLERSTVRFSRSVSGGNADMEGRVTVLYRVENLGEAPLTNLRVTDRDGRYDAQEDTLAPGETTLFVRRTEITEELVSAPTLTCMLGDTRVEQKLPEYTIGIPRPELTLSVQLLPQKGNEVLLRAELVNSGDVPLRGIRVDDDIRGGIVADGITLESGETTYVEQLCRVEPEGYRLRVTGHDDMYDTVERLSDLMYLQVSDTVKEGVLEINARTEKPKLSRAGLAPVEITVTNSGETMVRKAVLAEETLGTFYTLVVVGAGDTVTRKLNVNVSGTVEFNFRVEYTDESGHLHTVYADPLTISTGSGGADPEPVPTSRDPLESMTPTGTSNPRLYGVLLGAGAVLALILLLAVVLPNQLKSRAEEDDEDDDDASVEEDDGAEEDEE